MTIDDAGWHYDTCSEHDLDDSCAATHIGMFFAWLAHHDLAAPGRIDITALRDRSMTPGAFLLARCGGEISGFMLTPKGLAFSQAAYRAYLGAYRRIPEVAAYPVTYAAPDTWETYEAVAPVISEAYQEYSEQAT